MQADGTANAGYASWLRLPKMLRIYRLLGVYRHLRKSVAQTSVTVGILRLMPLILGITHLYGCIWWYLGTVGQPHTEEELDARGGVQRSTWVYFYEGLSEAHLWSDKVCTCHLTLRRGGIPQRCVTARIACPCRCAMPLAPLNTMRRKHLSDKLQSYRVEVELDVPILSRPSRAAKVL